MSAMRPSGSISARRDARVKRVHISRNGRRICSDKPHEDGDVIWTNGNNVGATPNNTCKRCKNAYHK